MKDKKKAKGSIFSPEYNHLSKKNNQLEKIVLNSELFNSLVKKNKVKKIKKRSEGVIPYFIDPTKQIKPEFAKINEETKAHFEEIVDVSLDCKKTQDLIKMTAKLLIIALKHIDSKLIKKDMHDWILKNYNNDKVNEVFKLLNDPLSKVDSTQIILEKFKKPSTRLSNKNMDERKVISEEDKFRVRMGDRLYKCREIVPKDDMVIGILMDRKSVKKSVEEVGKDKVVGKKGN